MTFSEALGRFGWFSVRTVEKHVPFCMRPAKVPQMGSGLSAEVAEVWQIASRLVVGAAEV